MQSKVVKIENRVHQIWIIIYLNSVSALIIIHKQKEVEIAILNPIGIHLRKSYKDYSSNKEKFTMRVNNLSNQMKINHWVIWRLLGEEREAMYLRSKVWNTKLNNWYIYFLFRKENICILNMLMVHSRRKLKRKN